ncbi:MAG: alpha/beta fold hydrolase [Saprospiraceae bacterium]|nr:alpha/beta fold hydrolase [Saprospiraceae bacterium]
MSFKKTLKPLAIIITLFLLGAAFLVENVLPYSGIKPRRHKPEDMLWLLPKGVKPEDYGLRAREINIQTPDSLSLSALLVESNTDSTLATVVLLHGISACKEVHLERAKVLADEGYASLLLDLRAHGQSEGEYCTFGFQEKNDLRAVADTLAKLFPTRPMAIWGASLGGAIALQAMAVEPRYSFGIIESTFDEYNKVAMEYGADMMFGLRSHWLTDRVLDKSGRIGHFEPDSVKPVVAAARIDRPVLFIHGDKDARIPKWFGERNYEACPAGDKQWYLVRGAGHNNLWKIAGDSMRVEVLQFLRSVNDGR